MKKLFYPVLALLAVSMASCTNNDEPNDEVDNLVPIQLSAGIGEITTKAAILPKDAFEAQVYATKTTEVYTDASLFVDGTINITATTGIVSFTTPQYYPTDGSSIYMKGFAQRGTVTNGIVSYTINGTQDIMVTDQVLGSKSDDQNKSLEFKHLLTQLKIKVVADNAAVAAAWGNITAITIKDVPTALDLALADGSIAANSAPATASLALEGFTNPLAIPTETAVDAGTIMLLPSESAFTLSITTALGGTKDVLVSQTKTEASKAYEITVTFKGTLVETKASVGEWTPVTGGTATVQ